MSQGNQFKMFKNLPSEFIKKGDVLIQSGSKANNAYYVVTGCLRSFIVDDKGKEHIYQFAPEDWIISDLEFLKNGGNAFLNIDAIEDSEIKMVSMEMFYQISYSDKQIIEASLNKLHNRIYSLQKRVIQLLAHSADERYSEFIKTYPNLYNRIPLKMIASYLGVTPESLSRIRKELTKSR